MKCNPFFTASLVHSPQKITAHTNLITVMYLICDLTVMKAGDYNEH